MAQMLSSEISRNSPRRVRREVRSAAGLAAAGAAAAWLPEAWLAVRGPSPPSIPPTLTPSKRPSPGGGTPISPEQRERIKRNKAEAERKLAAARARRTSAVKSAYERPAFCYDST